MARIRETINVYRLWWESVRGGVCFESLDVSGRIILKQILEKKFAIL